MHAFSLKVACNLLREQFVLLSLALKLPVKLEGKGWTPTEGCKNE